MSDIQDYVTLIWVVTWLTSMSLIQNFSFVQSDKCEIYVQSKQTRKSRMTIVARIYNH